MHQKQLLFLLVCCWIVFNPAQSSVTIRFVIAFGQGWAMRKARRPHPATVLFQARAVSRAVPSVRPSARHGGECLAE